MNVNRREALLTALAIPVAGMVKVPARNLSPHVRYEIKPRVVMFDQTFLEAEPVQFGYYELDMTCDIDVPPGMDLHSPEVMAIATEAEKFGHTVTIRRMEGLPRIDR